MRAAFIHLKSGVKQHRFLFYAYVAFVGSLFLSHKTLYPTVLFTHKVLLSKAIFAFCLIPLFLLSHFQAKPNSALHPSVLFVAVGVYLGETPLYASLNVLSPPLTKQSLPLT